MIKPTVGRVVLFHQLDYKIPCTPTKPLPALIVDVLTDSLVSLVVFDRYGHPHPFPNCRLVQPEEPKPETAFCGWMPFQISQAPAAQDVLRRLDDLQSRLAALETRLSGGAPVLAGSVASSVTPAPPLPSPPL